MIFNDDTVAQYERMVAGIAWFYTADPETHKDLMQEGFIGLGKACDGYDPSRGAFTTYAYPKIRAQIQQYYNYKLNVVHIPLACKKKDKDYFISLDTGNGEWTPNDAIETNKAKEIDGVALVEKLDLMAIVNEDMPEILYEHYIMEVSKRQLSKRMYGRTDETGRSRVRKEIQEALQEMRELLGVN